MMKPWTSTFQDAEERLLDIALAATPQQRLEWLEEAQQFALKSGLVDGQGVDCREAKQGQATTAAESTPAGAPESSGRSHSRSR